MRKELKIGEWYYRMMGYGGGDSQMCCIRRKTGEMTPNGMYSLCRKEGMGMFKLPVTEVFEAVDERGRVHKVTANDLADNGHIGIGTLETPKCGGHVAWLYREYAQLLVETGRYTAEEITAVFPMALTRYDDIAYEAYIEAHNHEFTPMTDKQEEILRAGYDEEQKKKKREEEEAARKYAAEVERLRKVYDYIPCPITDGNRWIPVKDKRRNVLAVLKHEFPGVKFSAKTRNGSTSDSIHVEYEDGPAYDKVMKVFREFETTCYNAYEDIHEDCTEPAACVCGGFDYVFLNRTTSEDVYKYVHDYIMAHVGGASEEYARGKAHKICASTDFPDGGFTIEGMTLGDNGEWTLHIKPKAENPTPPDTHDGNGGKKDRVVVTENTEKHGIEIRFPSIPDESVRTSMKSNGWRFSYRDGGKWYNRLTDENKAFAVALADSLNREVA